MTDSGGDGLDSSGMDSLVGVLGAPSGEMLRVLQRLRQHGSQEPTSRRQWKRLLGPEFKQTTSRKSMSGPGNVCVS
jgi:hypothetical protein